MAIRQDGTTSLEDRAARMRTRLAKKSEDDPTVLAAFDAAFADLLEEIEAGLVRYAHAAAILIDAYRDLLPAAALQNGRTVNLPAANARAVPRHGQFYRRLDAQRWLAIDWAESDSRQQTPNREIWLTYPRGATQANAAQAYGIALDRQDELIKQAVARA